jgi:hypothetical protein
MFKGGTMLSKKKQKLSLKRKTIIVTASLILLSEFSGCSPTLTIGGYEHVDMSRSCYREQIRQKADELATSPVAQDKRVAAELYGSIGELDLMDKCIAEYFNKEPGTGIYLLMRGEEIHRYYKSSR